MFWTFVVAVAVLCGLLIRLGWALTGSGLERAAQAQEDCAEVETFDGEGSQQTQPFQISGSSFRLDYAFEANTDIPDASFLFIDTYATGEDLPVNSTSLESPGEDSSFVNAEPGEYYLDINSANGRWTITVLDCGSGGRGTQYEEGPSDQGGSEQYQYEDTTATPPPDDPPLFTSGGPVDGPVPPMPDGQCPPEFPIQEDGSCRR